MADSKVSALTELAVQPADTDEFYINDGGVSKRITSITMRTSPIFVTPLLGTPTSGVLTNCTGAPALAITNMTGTGTNLTFVTPILGTPQSGVLTNCTGSPTLTTVTLGTLATAVEAAEHGAGAIGTGVAPATYRWIEMGVIITQIKVDAQGLRSVADADDVIGLQAGGAAYIGRNVVATNGVIFKVRMDCVETPAGGDNDVNLTTSSSAAAAYDTDGAAFGVVLNAGDWVAGTSRENLVPALTANDYFYLTAGTGDTGADYTAGQWIVTLYGHPVLT